MSADSEKPNIIGDNWMKYCTVAKSVRRSRPGDLNVRRRLRARRLRSATGSINSGRHILESRCAERCANDEFLTSFRATLKSTFASLFDGSGPSGVALSIAMKRQTRVQRKHRVLRLQRGSLNWENKSYCTRTTCMGSCRTLLQDQPGLCVYVFVCMRMQFCKSKVRPPVVICSATAL